MPSERGNRCGALPGIIGIVPATVRSQNRVPVGAQSGVAMLTNKHTNERDTIQEIKSSDCS